MLLLARLPAPVLRVSAIDAVNSVSVLSACVPMSSDPLPGRPSDNTDAKFMRPTLNGVPVPSKKLLNLSWKIPQTGT